MPQSSKPCGRLTCQIVGWHTAPCDVPNDPPAETPDVVRLKLDRRELASIRAGLKLLLQVAGPGSRDYVACRLVDAISSENDTIEPLTAAEIGDLVRRLA